MADPKHRSQPMRDARALYWQWQIEGHPTSNDRTFKMPGDSFVPRRAEHFVLQGREHSMILAVSHCRCAAAVSGTGV